jgi:hypothetical protein
VTDLKKTIKERIKAKPRKKNAGFYIEADLLTLLYAEANRNDCSASAIVNELVRDYCGHKAKRQKP